MAVHYPNPHTHPIGHVLRSTKSACILATEHLSDYQAYQAQAQCMLQNLTAYEVAIIGAHQYALTLWPAFVGAICAWGPDPGDMVYDNVWWAAMFAMTCSGLPGVNAAKPPHHIDATSTKHGRTLCESWKPTAQSPRELSRSLALSKAPPRPKLVIFEWISLLICLSMYFVFCFWFVRFLSQSYVILFTPQYWLAPLASYLLSAVPAISTVILSEALQHRVELYEALPHRLSAQSPTESERSEVVKLTLPSGVSASITTTRVKVSKHESLLDVSYQQVPTATIFHLWSRVLRHQWNRRYYRLLVKPPSAHPYFSIIQICIGLMRLAVFAVGSIFMGNIILPPIPQDLGLFALLLITTSVPRNAWPKFWSNGVRGADLVVFVKPVGVLDE